MVRSINIKKYILLGLLINLSGCHSANRSSFDPFLDVSKELNIAYCAIGTREDSNLFIIERLYNSVKKSKNVYSSIDAYYDKVGPFLNFQANSITFFYHDVEGFKIELKSNGKDTSTYEVLNFHDTKTAQLYILHNENKVKVRIDSVSYSYKSVPEGLEKWLGKVVLQGEYMDTTSRINFMITDNEICFGDKCYKYVIGYDFFELGKENYLYYNIDDRQVVVGYKANSNGILFYKSIDLGDSIKYEKMPFLSLQKVES